MTPFSSFAEQTTGQTAFFHTGIALVRRLLLPALDLIFPPVCVGCERVGSLLCDRCAETFTPIPTELMNAAPPLSGKIALGIFGGTLQQAVHALKYEHTPDIALPLGSLLAEAVRHAGWPSSVIVPVPLHDRRLRERGYNQSALLGQVLAAQLGWSQEADLLRRARETRPQVGLGYRERQENVAGAFVVTNPARVHDRDMVVIDDVYTTGATLGECAAALLAAGARSVRAAVIGQAAHADPQ